MLSSLRLRGLIGSFGFHSRTIPQLPSTEPSPNAPHIPAFLFELVCDSADLVIAEWVEWAFWEDFLNLLRVYNVDASAAGALDPPSGESEDWFYLHTFARGACEP